MILNSYSQGLPLYTNPALKGDLWDLTWLNHLIVLYSPATKDELHCRFLTLFKMVAYSAICNKAIADSYYKKMEVEIRKVLEAQGGERPGDAWGYYEGRNVNAAKKEVHTLSISKAAEETSLPIYDSPANLLDVVMIPPVLATLPAQVSSSIDRAAFELEAPQKLWASYRIHPDQREVTAMPSFRLYVQGKLARERGLTDLATSIVCAGWSSGLSANDLPIEECGVSKETWTIFSKHIRHLSSPEGFAKLPMLLQTLILESALVKTAKRVFDLRCKTQVGEWEDWYSLLKKGPIVVKATIGDRYQRGTAIATGDCWGSEPIFAYPLSAVRVAAYITENPFNQPSVVIGANPLILVGGENSKTKQEEYGKSCIYFRQSLGGALFKMTWNEFLLNLVSFDGLLYSSTFQGKSLNKRTKKVNAVWAIYAS